MNGAAAFNDELTRIGDIIVAARDLVADGQLINLTPLEGEINRICQGLTSLSGPEAETVKPVLLSLMDELDRLAGEMRARQAEYEAELRTLSSHAGAARASRAYDTAPRSGRKPK